MGVLWVHGHTHVFASGVVFPIHDFPFLPFSPLGSGTGEVLRACCVGVSLRHTLSVVRVWSCCERVVLAWLVAVSVLGPVTPLGLVAL